MANNDYESYLCNTPRGVPRIAFGQQIGWTCPRHNISFNGLNMECPLCEEDRRVGYEMRNDRLRKEAEAKKETELARAIRQEAAAKRKKEAELMAKIKKRQDDKDKIDITAPIKSLLERAYMELKYKNCYKAELYFETVLELDGKLPRDKNLTSVKNPTDIVSRDYNKHAIADTEVKSRIDNYIKIINDRIRIDK